MPETYVPYSPPLHFIERQVSGAQKLLDRRPIFRINCLAHADCDEGLQPVVRKALADPRGRLFGVAPARFRQDERKLVAAVTRGRVNRPAAASQDLSQTLDRAASR